MSNNFRIMKAVSIEMYKRMINGCSGDSSIASTSIRSTALSNPYGAEPSSIEQKQIQAGGGNIAGSYKEKSAAELDEIPDTFFESKVVDEDPKVTLTLLRSIPDAQRNRARNLINAILPHRVFSWDNAGVITYRDTLYPKSNIVDLINVATRSTKIRKLKIPGLKVFIHFLKSINIPKHYLGSHFSSLMDEEEDGFYLQDSNYTSNNTKNYNYNSTSQTEPNCSAWVKYEDVFLV